MFYIRIRYTRTAMCKEVARRDAHVTNISIARMRRDDETDIMQRAHIPYSTRSGLPGRCGAREVRPTQARSPPVRARPPRSVPPPATASPRAATRPRRRIVTRARRGLGKRSAATAAPLARRHASGRMRHTSRRPANVRARTEGGQPRRKRPPTTSGRQPDATGSAYHDVRCCRERP